MVLADTNFFIDVLGKEPEATKLLDRLAAGAEPLRIPALALHELYYGARLHAEHEREVARIRELERAIPPLAYRPAAARQAGLIEAELEKGGLRPSRSDVQIAASALVEGEPVVSRDGGFEIIPGLEILKY